MKRALLGLMPILLTLLAAPPTISGQEPPALSKAPGTMAFGKPIEMQMKRAGSTNLDLRLLPQTSPEKFERPEIEEPEAAPVEFPGTPQATSASPTSAPTLSAAAPSPSASFDGLDYQTWGAGHPPDTNGDVGPNHYIQTMNTSIGIFAKSGGAPIAAFTFNTFMSQGSFGNLCDTDNYGDPVVLYDTFEDRWVITDFAFTLTGSTVNSPPGAFQCFAVSKTGDPVSGGWNFYSINTAGGLGDYPKFGIWTDGIYMSANLFNYAGSSFLTPRVYAFNKAQMYAGVPTIQVVSFDAPASEFTLLPANARLQTGTPPPGSPNYMAVVWQYLNVVSVYKFHVDWNSISTSSLTGPFSSLTATSWSQFTGTNGVVPSPQNSLDTLYPRLMMQNQYTNLGGVESLWDSHTVGASGATSAQAAVRYYQVKVTGGTVEANATQAFTWSPDTTIHRFMPSLAVDRAGDMAIGYTAANGTLNPALRYAGRLAGDPVNTMSQTETSLIEGTGSQSGACNGTCTRWGDYSAMSLDPNGCTLWYTGEYYAANGLNDLTRIGSFTFPSCTPVTKGTVSGTVTATVGGAPISGATVALGSRTTTTDGSGFYQFNNIPSGTYPSISAGAAGFNASTFTSIVVTDSATTTQNFSLGTAPSSGCFTDSSQGEFQTCVPTNVDLTTNPGDAILLNAANIDQQNLTVTPSGFGFTSTAWAGQTFTPGVTGQVTQVDVDLFCSTCTGTTPNITVSIRATTGATPVPTGADLATATITGFNSAAGGFFSAVFASPPTLTAGTRYAVILRAVSNPSAGTYAYVCSCTTTGFSNTNPYANGQRVTSANSGSTWTADTTVGGRDLGFKVYMKTGFPTSGNLASGLKDANPAVGYTTTWSALSWNASIPANTGLKFQVAGSNSPDGPFNFVGPDGTASTFFTTSGAALTPQFDGKRYLKYKAYLSSTNTAATPVVNDVTVCFTDTLSAAPPDLSLTKSDGGASVAAGGAVAYALTYSNSGGQGATGAVLTETVPTNSVFNVGASTAGWVCAPNNNAGSTCTLALGTIAAGGGNSATFAVNVVNPVAAGVAQIANTASIADDGTHGSDPTPGNNVASDTTPVNAQPDLSLTKSDGGASVAPGGTASYTLSYANAGNQDATGVVLTETVPANTAFNAGASTAGWNCTPNGNSGATCTLSIGGLVSGGGTLTATFAVTVANPVAAGVTQISNTASINDDGTNGSDPTPGNNSGSDTTPVTGAPDFSLTKSDGGANVPPGGTVSYTLTYGNSGNRGASGVALTETVPAHTTFNAGASTAGWNCSPNNNAGASCTLAIGGLAAGSGGLTATFAVTVDGSLPGGTTQISNTASIADDGTNGVDPTPGNNSGSDTTPISGASPDLTLTKSDGGASVAPGGAASYTLTYANSGSIGATGVVITETVPANTTFNAGASTAGWVCSPNNNAGSSCTLTVGSVVAGSGNQTATFAVTVVNPVAAGVTQISNTASIADDGNNGSDPTPGNNSGSDTTPVTAAPDLTLTKSDGGATAKPAFTFAYTLTYANVGNQDATGVVLSETVPANTTFVAGSSTAGWICTPDANAGSTCTLAVGALTAGSGNQAATFAVKVANPLPNGVTQISNTASIADDGSNGADPTPANNTGSDTTPIVGLEYFTVQPCRLVDSRLSGGPLASGVERTVTATGVCTLPVDALAIAINLTAVSPTGDGFTVVYPISGQRPGTSNLSFRAGRTRANNGVVYLAADGKVQVWFSVAGAGSSDFIIDVVGYFK